ncbi:MAG: glutaredoxin family protein [Chloroflexi bacterium]|nr:glutaredoxin family protein [Chloroflexota bacterium]
MAASGPRVTLYSKPGCHLCELAEALIAAVARSQPLTVEHVNIESSPELFAEYRYRIPVIAVAGGQTLDWPTTAERLRKAVVAASSAP